MTTNFELRSKPKERNCGDFPESKENLLKSGRKLGKEGNFVKFGEE